MSFLNNAHTSSLVWTDEQDYDVNSLVLNPETSEEMLIQIVADAPFKVLIEIVRNPNVTSTVLEAITYSFNTSYEEDRKLLIEIAGNENASTELLQEVFHSLLNYPEDLVRLAGNRNVSQTILKELLPDNTILGWDEWLNKSVAPSESDRDETYYKLCERSKNALLNPSTNIVDVFTSLQHVTNEVIYNKVMDERFVELVKFCETNYKVDVSSWAVEWVLEYIKDYK